MKNKKLENIKKEIEQGITVWNTSLVYNQSSEMSESNKLMAEFCKGKIEALKEVIQIINRIQKNDK